MKAAFHFHAIRRSRVLWWINDRLGERERVLKKKKRHKIFHSICVLHLQRRKNYLAGYGQAANLLLLPLPSPLFTIFSLFGFRVYQSRDSSPVHAIPTFFLRNEKLQQQKKIPATFRLPATSPTGGTCATRIHFKSRDNCWPRIKIANKDRPMGCADLFGKVDGFCLSLWDVAVTACRSLVAVYVGRQISIRPRPITASVYKANNALQFSMAN